MKKLDNGNHIVRAPTDLEPHISDDGVHPNTTTMVGLVFPQGDADEVTEAFEQKGYVWVDKEKRVPGPFYAPEDDELTGDRKFTFRSNFLTTSTYNLHPNVHHVETELKKSAHMLSGDGSEFISRLSGSG